MRTDHSQNSPNIIPYLSFLSLAVIGIKFVFVLLSPDVLFYFGDSESYIDTRVGSWIPPDRSFVYGLLITPITHMSGSLTSLLAVQILCSAASAVLLGWSLRSFFGTKPTVAFFFALLCAAEPLQVMFERYVMAETLSLFFFVLYLVCVFLYLRSVKAALLVCMSFLGLAAIAFRISYLPVVLVSAFLVPILAFAPQVLKVNNKDGGTKGISLGLDPKTFLRLVFHLVLSAGMMFLTHSVYKRVNGALSERPPAYQYADGLFLIASWAPVLDASDFPVPQRSSIYQPLRESLRDFSLRERHRWGRGLLVDRIHDEFGDDYAANEFARSVALNALTRNPLGVLKAAFYTYWAYWGRIHRHVWDHGEIPIPERFSRTLAARYDLHITDLYRRNRLVKVYFLSATGWYYLLTLMPVLILLSFIPRGAAPLRYLLYLTFVVWAVIFVATLVVMSAQIRFLHPFGWLAPLLLGVFAQKIVDTWTRRRGAQGLD